MVGQNTVSAGRAARRPGGARLSTLLREQTREVHRRAERSGVISDLLAGMATLDAYLTLLRNLHPVYTAMERRLSESPGGFLGMLARPAVYRSRALRHDLEALGGPRWSDRYPRLAAGADYSARVAAVPAHGLVAHAYVRYLGDLNGGRVLKRVLASSLGIGDGCLSFYSFPDIGDVPAFIADYRRALDRIGAAVDVFAVAAEAERAFELNVSLSRAIQEAA